MFLLVARPVSPRTVRKNNIMARSLSDSCCGPTDMWSASASSPPSSRICSRRACRPLSRLVDSSPATGGHAASSCEDLLSGDDHLWTLCCCVRPWRDGGRRGEEGAVARPGRLPAREGKRKGPTGVRPGPRSAANVLGKRGWGLGKGGNPFWEKGFPPSPVLLVPSPRISSYAAWAGSAARLRSISRTLSTMRLNRLRMAARSLRSYLLRAWMSPARSMISLNR